MSLVSVADVAPPPPRLVLEPPPSLHPRGTPLSQTNQQRYDESASVVLVCGDFMIGEATADNCLSKVIETIGWKWAFVVFSYAYLAFLTVVQGMLVRLCCGKLRAAEQGAATAAVLGRMWRSFVFLNVVLAPKVSRVSIGRCFEGRI